MIIIKEIDVDSIQYPSSSDILDSLIMYASNPSRYSHILSLLEEKTGRKTRELFNDSTSKFLSEIKQNWTQDWKSVAILFQKFLKQASFPCFTSQIHLLIPPISTLIEDYEPSFKLIGIDLIEHVFINNIPSADVRLSGILEHFLKTLEIHATFHSEPNLIRESTRILVDLVKVTHASQSRGYYELCNHLIERMAHGLVMSRGGNPHNITSFLKAATKLSDKLGLLSIKYCRYLSSLACIQLTEFCATDPLIAAIDLLISLVKNCWPRYLSS